MKNVILAALKDMPSPGKMDEDGDDESLDVVGEMFDAIQGKDKEAFRDLLKDFIKNHC